MQMRKLRMLLAITVVIGACKKHDNPVKSDHYRDVTYRVDARDSFLFVQFSRAQYDNVAKGNLKIDTNFSKPGVYFFKATVLADNNVILYGESRRSGNYGLQIIGPGNVLISSIDSLTLDPANQLHPNIWYASIKANF